MENTSIVKIKLKTTCYLKINKAGFVQNIFIKAVFHVICKANITRVIITLQLTSYSCDIATAERIQRTVVSRKKIRVLTLISQLGIVGFLVLKTDHYNRR